MADTYAHRPMKIIPFYLTFILTLVFLQLSCTNGTPSESGFSFRDPEDTSTRVVERYKYFIDTPVCTEEGVSGVYKGVEFVDWEYAYKLNLTGRDIAHNYSNVICRYVGDHLKELYRKGNYSKVDLKHIRMTTRGMGDGDRYVEYRIYLPLIRVSKRNAMTGFDHSGGWGHTPDLKKRKKDLLKGKIVKRKKLYISPLYKTPEGLEEYWIQWQHADLQ
jgi:hypothetical protein